MLPPLGADARAQFAMPSNANCWRGIFLQGGSFVAHQVSTDLAGGQGGVSRHSDQTGPNRCPVVTCAPPQCCVFSSIQPPAISQTGSVHMAALLMGAASQRGAQGRSGEDPTCLHATTGASRRWRRATDPPVGLVYSGHIRPGIATLRFLRFFSLLLFKIWIRQNSS